MPSCNQRSRQALTAPQHAVNTVPPLSCDCPHPAPSTLHTCLPAGINFAHPSYGECTAVNHPDRRCKVVAGYNFVGDKYSGTRQGPSPVAGGQPVSCVCALCVCVCVCRGNTTREAAVCILLQEQHIAVPLDHNLGHA